MPTPARIGYSSALERTAPAEAVELAVYAESRGFVGTTVSDPYQPWTPQGGQAGHVWTVLGALGARTRGPLATSALTAGYRVHPAVVAQASATTAAMFPGRHWLGLGAGDAVSEHVVGGYWPEVPERINRMFEAAEVIGKLFKSGLTGKDVRHNGPHFTLETSRLWTMPPVAPPIVVSTAGPVTARRAGRFTDGIMTIGTDLARAALLLEKFDEGRRDAGKSLDDAVRAVRLDIAWAPTDDDALAAALTNWPIGGLRVPRGDVRSPFELAMMARSVSADDLRGRMTVTSDPDVVRSTVQSYLDLGFTDVHLHDVGPDPRAWMDVAGREILPRLHH